MAQRRSSTYINALTQYYKQNVKGHFLEKAKAVVKNSKLLLNNTALKHKAVYSNIDGYFAGSIYGAFNGFPKALQKNLDVVSLDYMSNVFAMSQRLVPIDKKYIGIVNAGDIGELKTPRSYLIPSKSRFEQVESFNHNTAAQLVYKYRDPKYYYHGKYSTKLDLPAGYYYNNGLIKDFFLSSNKRKRWQLYVDEEGTVGAYYSKTKRAKTFGNIKDIKPIDPRTIRTSTKEITGGNQELKKGGYFNKKRRLIVYSSKAGGAKFDYAQVQHDNLAYKHAPGKQALYLYDAFEHYRNRFVDAIKTESIKTFTKQFKKNPGVTKNTFNKSFIRKRRAR